MVAWWPLDETSRRTALDLVATHNGLQATNPNFLTDGKVGGAWRFTTASDYIEVPSDNDLNFGTGDFSIDAWIRTSDQSLFDRTIVDKRCGTIASPKGYVLDLNSGRLTFQLEDGTGFAGNFRAMSPTLTDGVWHHVAATVVRASGGVTLYVDGVARPLDSSPSVKTGSVSNDCDLLIGQRGPAFGQDNAFNGDIDEVELFSRALSSTDIQSIYNNGSSSGQCKCLLQEHDDGPGTTSSPIEGSDLAQSFKPALSFDLCSAELTLTTSQSCVMTLFIQDVPGPTPSQIYSQQTMTVPTVNSGNVLFPLPPVQLVRGQTYYMRLTSSGCPNASAVWHFETSDYYPSGQAYHGTSSLGGDFLFRVRGIPRESGPDLMFVKEVVHPVIGSETPTTCEVTEGCVVGGKRRLLRFNAYARNVGTADLVLGDPHVNPLDRNGNPMFEYNACHGHYHFNGFARYNLLDANGVVVLGKKSGFCLRDNTNIDGTPTVRFRDCESYPYIQGLQAGWEDHYWYGLPCQYIDVTDVPAGDYTLCIELNPFGIIEETNYSNNKINIPVTIPPPHQVAEQVPALADWQVLGLLLLLVGTSVLALRRREFA
jgi:hypothetical protein